MKKLLPFASLLLLAPLLAANWPTARAQAPEGPQGKPVVAPTAPAPQADAQSLEARVAALETALAAEKKKNDETRALLDQTLAYLDKQSKAAQSMLDVLGESEKQGFAVGENFHSRETLLAGMRAYWSEAQSGIPKAPAPPPAAKPALPTRAQRATHK